MGASSVVTTDLHVIHAAEGEFSHHLRHTIFAHRPDKDGKFGMMDAPLGDKGLNESGAHHESGHTVSLDLWNGNTESRMTMPHDLQWPPLLLGSQHWLVY